MDNKKFFGIFMPRASFYLWFIFIQVVIIAFFDFRIAIPAFVLLAFLVYYNFRSNYLREKEITRYIENLTFNIDTATKDTLLNFPMPLVVLELDGTIIWYNSSFRKIFGGENLLEKTISLFVEELHPDKLPGQSPNFSKDIIINERHYCVLGNIVKTEEKNEAEKFILLLYLVDNTELVQLKKKYIDEKTAIGIIIIDNYDDLMQSMEDSKRPQMLAEIERKVAQWAGFAGGILKKFERDKYIFIFNFKYLKELEDRRFEILDTVKEINVGNRIPVTLSLGFGVNGNTLAENFSFSAASIDIALGRGGDQVVVKNGENFYFFGGKTRELEKRTRVKARVIAHALRELIDQAPSVMLMGHENSDIDCLGAELGLYRIAKSRGKEVHILLNQVSETIDNLVNKMSKMPEYSDIIINCEQARNIIDRKTLLIVVDTHRPGFTECPDLLKLTEQVVVIDHHRKGADFIQDAVLTYQETYASSTSELVTELLLYVDDRIKLNSIEAEALYAGIVVDTKNFTFKTGVRTFEAAAFLRRQGVDTISVKQLFQNDLSTYINISNIVKNAEIIRDNIAISTGTPNIRNAQLISAKAADQLLSLTGISAAFVLGSLNNEVFISGRSLGDINVQVMLEKLGGGGHMTVAGAQLPDVTIDEAKERLKNVINEYFENANKEI